MKPKKNGEKLKSVGNEPDSQPAGLFLVIHCKWCHPRPPRRKALDKEKNFSF